MAAPILASMRDRLERRLGFQWEELNVPTLGRAMRIPLLVIHDRKDREHCLEAWRGRE